MVGGAGTGGVEGMIHEGHEAAVGMTAAAGAVKWEG
jgi:hypothetical protein